MIKRCCRNALILSAFCSSAQATLTFQVAFTANALANYTPAEQQFFQDGLDFWDAIIDGHQDGVSRTWTLSVDSFDEGPMNGGITLGSAGPTGLLFSNVVPGSGLGAPGPDRFILAGGGQAEFNTNAAAGPLDPIVVRHEIGHALGIGTLWEDNEVYNDGNAGTGNRTLAGGTPGQYTGANALAAYQDEFDTGATFIPIELDGGGGTAHGHWNMVTDHFNPALENQAGFDSDPGDGVAAPTDGSGNSLDDELMTGVRSGSGFLSETSIQSLIDIGFTLEPTVPEPSSALLAGLGLILLGRRRR